MFIYLDKNFYLKVLTWGLGIGDWGLGIGDWGLGPIPNPPSPTPHPQYPNLYNLFIYNNKNKFKKIKKKIKLI